MPTQAPELEISLIDPRVPEAGERHRDEADGHVGIGEVRGLGHVDDVGEGDDAAAEAHGHLREQR